MFCKECGTENDIQHTVCNKCGAKLKSSNKFLLIGALLSILVVIVLAIPMITNHFIDNKIKEETAKLKEIGLQFDVIRSNGYFISNKEIDIKINNGRYFSNYILDELIKSSETDSKVLIETIKKANIDWETFLNGTTFKGNLVSNNYMLDKPKLDIFLNKLSHDIMYEIQKDKEVSKIILPLLDKKIFRALVEFNKQGVFEKLKINDIDETIVKEQDRVVFQLLDNTFENNTLGINRLYLSIKDNTDILVFQLDKIKSQYDDKNHYNLNVDNLSFSSDKFKMSAKNLKTEQLYDDKNVNINLFTNFSVEDILVDTKDLPISIGKINYNVNLDEISKKEFNTIFEDYKNKSANVDEYGEYELGNLFKFLNSGFIFKTDINVENLKIKDIKSGHYSFRTNMKIKRNDLNLSNIDINKILNIIESTDGGEYSFLDITIDEESSKFIMNSSKEFKNIFDKLGFLKDKEYSFRLWKKEDKVVLNNLELSYVSHVIGDNFFENEEYNSAINFYKYAIENKKFDAYFRLAYSYNAIEKYDLAIDSYMKYIEQLDVTKENQLAAMNNLARVYLYGKEDYINTIKWSKKAQDNGYEKDNFLIAYSYDMLKNYKNAEIYYLKSIEKDNTSGSMWNLGLMYEFGNREIVKNEKKAFDLYLKAANLNYEDAFKKVSLMYQYGIGTTRDLQKAKFWRNKLNNDLNNTQIDEEFEYSTIKKQYDENGISLEIEYPAIIIPNSYVDFKITMTNNLPYIDTKGGISVGFPQFSDLDVINIDSTLDIKSYPSKSKLWNGNMKKTISSEYFMLEGWEKDWKQNQKKTINFSVFINDYSELNDINIFVRSVLISNKVEYVNPIDGFNGQQGYKNVNISIPLNRD
jgi:TPR repeat protein